MPPVTEVLATIPAEGRRLRLPALPVVAAVAGVGSWIALDLSIVLVR